MSCERCEMCDRLVDTDYDDPYREGFLVLKPIRIPIYKNKDGRRTIYKTIKPSEIVFTDSLLNTVVICDICWEEHASEEQFNLNEEIRAGKIKLKYGVYG